MNRQKRFRKIVDVFAKKFAINVCPPSCLRRGHGNDYADNRNANFERLRGHTIFEYLCENEKARETVLACSCEAQVESFKEKK